MKGTEKGNKMKNLLLVAIVSMLAFTTQIPLVNAKCYETRVGSVQCLDYKGRVISSKVCAIYAEDKNDENNQSSPNIFSSFRSKMFSLTTNSSNQEDDSGDYEPLDVSHTMAEKPNAPNKRCEVACPPPPPSNNNNDNDKKNYKGKDGKVYGSSESADAFGGGSVGKTDHGTGTSW